MKTPERHPFGRRTPRVPRPPEPRTARRSLTPPRAWCPPPRWDTDESGSIEEREFAAALAALGLEEGASSVAAMFADFDVDSDGKISYAELKAALGGGKRKPRPRKEEPSTVGLPPAELKRLAEEKKKKKKAGGRRETRPGGGGGGGDGDGDGDAMLVSRVRAKMTGEAGRVLDTFRSFDRDGETPSHPHRPPTPVRPVHR